MEITDNCAFCSEIWPLLNGNRLLETTIVLSRTLFALLEPVSLTAVTGVNGG